MLGKKRLKALISISANLEEMRLSLDDCLPVFKRHSTANHQNLHYLSVNCGQIHTELIKMSKVQVRIAEALEQIAESLKPTAVNHDNQADSYPTEDERL
jgi:hypothetical protein